MHVFGSFVTCVCILGSLAADTENELSCSWTTKDENIKSGYEFLDDDRRVYLAATSLDAVFTMPDRSKISCISSVTSEKNNLTHELVATVDYKYVSSGKWDRFSQIYKFVQVEERFNQMELKETNGAPLGLYTFMYASRDCAVAKIEGFKVRLSDEGEGTGENAAEEISRSAVGMELPADETTEGKAHCMIWTKHGNPRALEKSCEPHFLTCCKRRSSEYSYNPNDCKFPEERSEL